MQPPQGALRSAQITQFVTTSTPHLVFYHFHHNLLLSCKKIDFGLGQQHIAKGKNKERGGQLKLSLGANFFQGLCWTMFWGHLN